MTAVLQSSLFDQAEPVALRTLDSLTRTTLRHGAWIDVLPGWLTGADTLFDRLVTQVPWRAEERPMYDRVVAVPRLLSFYDEDDALPDAVLDEARAVLSRHYAAELGEPFRAAGPRTPWSRSSRSVRRGRYCCAHAEVGTPCGTRWATVTSSSWAAPVSGRGSTPCRRQPDPWVHGSASSSVHAGSADAVALGTCRGRSVTFRQAPPSRGKGLHESDRLRPHRRQ
jgi:hypothetical protein